MMFTGYMLHQFSQMVLLYFSGANPNPTEMIGLLCPFSPLFLAINYNLPEVVNQHEL